jgi:hypothetical protein
MVGSTRRLMVGSSNAAPTLRGEMGGGVNWSEDAIWRVRGRC